MADAPAFLNKFPAEPVPTPQGNPGPGFIHNGAIDPGNIPGPVTPPDDLPGPIHMQSGWHQGPGVAVSGRPGMTYGQTDEVPDLVLVEEEQPLLPKLLTYAGLTALGFAAGRKFAPSMPVAALQDSVPTAGALLGMGVAASVYKDYDGSLLRGLGLVAAAVGGAYAADLIYPNR